MGYLRAAWICTTLFAGVAGAQTLDNKSLTGKYYFRHLFVSTDAGGTTTEVRSLLGSLTYDGNGAYTFIGQQNIGSAAAGALTGTGTYSVSAAGFVTMTNPARGSLTLNARFGAEAVVGSSTESTDNVFDLFVAIPAPSGSSSNASVSGPYWASGMEFAGGSAAGVRDSFFLLQPDGAGNFAAMSVAGHAANQQQNVPFTQSVAGAKYQISGDGSGSATFSTSTLLAANKILYVSKSGNILLGGSTTAGAHDILIAVKALSGTASNASWKDKFWSAGLRVEGRNVSAFTGSANATGTGKLVVSRRVHAIGAGGNGVNSAIDFTGSNPYGIGTDGSGTALSTSTAIGAGGNAFVGSSKAPSEATTYEIYFGVRLPPIGGTGVYLNPQGVVNTASFAPVGSPIAPGEFIALFGSGLAPANAVATTRSFPLTLGGVSVTINDIPAPVYSVSATQITALVPFSVQGTKATIVVINSGTRSNAVEVPVAKTSPGIFSSNSSGLGLAATLHADFSLIDADHPVKRGETILVFLTGLGATSPTVPDGAPGPTAEPLARTTQTPIVRVGAQTARVLFSGLAPGFPGLYQLNVAIPGTAPFDPAVPLAIETGDHFHDQVDIPIEK